MMFVDARMALLKPLRQGVATILFPVQRALLFPRDRIVGGAEMISDLNVLRATNAQLRKEEIANAAVLLQAEQLAAENRELRKILGARDRLPVTSVMGQVLYEARDPFSRKLVIDKGSQDGLLQGQPVVDAGGVLGQVTRVFPLSAEVTIITDRSLTIPVQVARTGVRAIAYGGGQDGKIELRYLPSNADIKLGDSIVTSGLDGLYPTGLPVGKISAINQQSVGSFVPALVTPSGGVDRAQLLSVLLVDKSRLPPPPMPDEPVGMRPKKLRQ